MQYRYIVRVFFGVLSTCLLAILYQVSSVTPRGQGVGSPCPCEPGAFDFVFVTRPLSIGIAPFFDEYPNVRDSVRPGADYWQTFLASVGRGFTDGSYGSADIDIVVESLEEDEIARATFAADGTGLIRINITKLTRSAEAFRHVIAHELGHHLGFRDADCESSRTVMSRFLDSVNGPFIGGFADADRCVAQRIYRPEDHPTFSWCYGGGCTPGYSRSCDVGGDREIDECGCCWNFTPILIDLAGNGIAMGDPMRGAFFDINGLGRASLLSWPVGHDDAWLVLDINNNGVVDSGAELFGNTYSIRPGQLAQHGYEALASLDDNNDGRIDAHDPVFARLQLWLDSDQNGLSTNDELRPVSHSGILALSLDFRTMSRVDAWGNRYRYAAPVQFSTAPRLRWSVDVYPVRVRVSQ